MGNDEFDRIIESAGAGTDIRDLTRGMDLAAVAALLKRTGMMLDAAAEVKTKLQKSYDALRMAVIPELMDGLQLKSANVDGVGRVTLTSDAFVSVPAGRQQELQEWLCANGFEDMIKEQVNSSTLKAWAIRRTKAGEEVPECVNITPYSRASITAVS